MERTSIIIDTDPAMGLVGRDVDDGLLLFAALESPELDILGLTVCHGNASMSRCRKVARSLIRRMGRRGLEVLPGAGGPGELGVETRASRFIIDSLRRTPGAVALAVAPLTNVATALMLAPDIAADIGRLIVMGGAFRVPGNVPPFFKSEFNFWRDAEAARRVVGSGVETVIIPLDVTEKCLFTDENLAAIRRLDTRNARFAAGAVAPWLYMNKLVLRRDGFPMHDPVALGFALEPGLFQVESLPIEVSGAGFLTAGQCRIREEPAPPVVGVATGVDAEAVRSLLMERIIQACAGG